MKVLLVIIGVSIVTIISSATSAWASHLSDEKVKKEERAYSYSPWNAWSACSRTCGQGFSTRERIYKRKDSYSERVQSKSCILKKCTEPTAPPPLEHNIAVNGTATASSQFLASLPASNANDGDTNTDFYEGSCAMTGKDINPWFKIEFPTTAIVSAVTIFNREDCCGERLNNAIITVGMDPSGDTNTLCGTLGDMENVNVTTLRCSQPLLGMYVHVKIPGPQFLTVCELQVHGHLTTTPTLPPTTQRPTPKRRVMDLPCYTCKEDGKGVDFVGTLGGNIKIILNISWVYHVYHVLGYVSIFFNGEKIVEIKPGFGKIGVTIFTQDRRFKLQTAMDWEQIGTYEIIYKDLTTTDNGRKFSYTYLDAGIPVTVSNKLVVLGDVCKYHNMALVLDSTRLVNSQDFMTKDDGYLYYMSKLLDEIKLDKKKVQSGFDISGRVYHQNVDCIQVRKLRETESFGPTSGWGAIRRVLAKFHCFHSSDRFELKCAEGHLFSQYKRFPKELDKKMKNVGMIVERDVLPGKYKVHIYREESHRISIAIDMHSKKLDKQLTEIVDKMKPICI